jgi:hypothetical protein
MKNHQAGATIFPIFRCLFEVAACMYWLKHFALEKLVLNPSLGIAANIRFIHLHPVPNHQKNFSSCFS